MVGTPSHRHLESAVTHKTIQVTTPQFTRPKSDAPAASPPENWDDLKELDKNGLRELGFRPWNVPNDPEDEPRPGSCQPVNWVGFNGKTLMLLPGEWYAKIPAGFEIIDINGCKETFQPGVTDDDIRFGCLAYGILR